MEAVTAWERYCYRADVWQLILGYLVMPALFRLNACSYVEQCSWTGQSSVSYQIGGLFSPFLHRSKESWLSDP